MNMESHHIGIAQERRIGMIIDKLPGFDQDSARRLCQFLKNNTYNVKAFSVDEFRAAKGDISCSILIVPNASSFPADCAAELKDYSERGGQLLVLGGPMFNRLVKSINGQYKDCDYDKKYLDATFSGEMQPLVIDGLVPVYKTHPLYGQNEFMTEPDQLIFKGKVSSSKPLDAICPVPRPHGQGYGQKRKTRYLPLLQCMGQGGRGGGRRGAAAFFMLNDTFNYPFTHCGSRPGSVGSSIIGSVIAGIGFTEQQLLDIKGVDSLMTSMIEHMLRGVFLYEAGSDAFTYRVGDVPVLGARVLNARQDYLPVKLRFTLISDGQLELEHEADLLAAPRNISDFHCACPAELTPGRNYQVKVVLSFEGMPVDEISHEITFPGQRLQIDYDFVKVKNGDFYLRGETWSPIGINYWPNFFAGVEEGENWYGWLSDRYYDQLEVERDLSFLEDCGFNFVMTRLDGNIFDRSIPQLLDFLERCRKHKIRVSLAWPEAMSPLYYNEEAVAKLFAVTDINNDPTVVCYDLIWEMGGQPLQYRYWDGLWREWIEESYGSVEDAERDWSFPANRNENGEVAGASREQLSKDGEWRIMVAAFRRFMDDMISCKWNHASRDMRKRAPRQLLTYRMGCLGPLDVAHTFATAKHVDFLAPEGYSFQLGEDGFNASCFVSRFLDFIGNGKPIVWSEFGISSVGMRNGQLFWDRERLAPPREKILEQDSYLSQFYKMIIDTACNGLAPWWWSSGFRRREMSDFGFLAPDGTLRPCAESMVKLIPAFKRKRNRMLPEAWIEVDPDVRAEGYCHICFNSGRDAYAAASSAGKALGVRTPGTGSSSANVPALAVGNTPYNGSNPPKYLNSEFNEISLSDAEGNVWSVQNGGTVDLPAGNAELYLNLNIGNTQEAKWLAPEPELKKGAVYLMSSQRSDISVRQPIPHDVARFEDVEMPSIPLGRIAKKTRVCLRLAIDGVGSFGQTLSFTILPG